MQSKKEFFQWYHNQEGELIQRKTINNYQLKVKYLPNQWLLTRELDDSKEDSRKRYDSLQNYYQNTHTFLLTIMPDTTRNPHSPGVMRNVSGYREYRKKVQELNFNMEEHVKLETEQGTFKPVLTNMENTYGLEKHKSIYLVFAGNNNDKDLMKANKLDFVFSDYVFKTGINHFVFDKQAIESVPEFNFGPLKSIAQ